MSTAVRPVRTTVIDTPSVVQTAPQTLSTRVRTTTRQTIQTVKTRTTRHHRSQNMASQAATPYVMLVASDITDQAYYIFA